LEHERLYPLDAPPKDPSDRELVWTIFNKNFLLPEGEILTESLRKERRKVMAASERHRFGISGCTTVDGVIQVIKLRDSEASCLRHKIHLLDLRRLAIGTPTIETAQEWAKIFNEIRSYRIRLIELVGEAPVGLQRNHGNGGRPATWRTALFTRVNVIAAALDDKPAEVLRELFRRLEDTVRSRSFVKQMLTGFRGWRHRQQGRAGR